MGGFARHALFAEDRVLQQRKMRLQRVWDITEFHVDSIPVGTGQWAVALPVLSFFLIEFAAQTTEDSQQPPYCPDYNKAQEKIIDATTTKCSDR